MSYNLITINRHTPELYWLIHHGILLEPTGEPIKCREAYIQTNKPEHERAMRLKWMRKVANLDKLPPEVVAAFRKFKYASLDAQEADTELQALEIAMKRLSKISARKRNIESSAVYSLRRAINRNFRAIVRQHKNECPGCPVDYTSVAINNEKPVSASVYANPASHVHSMNHRIKGLKFPKAKKQ